MSQKLYLPKTNIHQLVLNIIQPIKLNCAKFISDDTDQMENKRAQTPRINSTLNLPLAGLNWKFILLYDADYLFYARNWTPEPA